MLDKCSLIIGMLFALTLLIIFAYLQYHKAKYNYRLENSNRAKELIDIIDTCDIISIVFSKTKGTLIKMLSGCPWCHVGLIYRCKGENRDRDQIYVLEMGYYDKSYKNVILIPLEKWFDKYDDKCTFALTRLQGPRPMDNQVLDLFNKLKNNNLILETFNISWSKMLIKEKYKVNDRKEIKKTSYICCEFVIHILQELNIIDKIYRVKLFMENYLVNQFIVMTFQFILTSSINFLHLY